MAKKYIEADALIEEIEKLKKYNYFAETSNIFTLLTKVDVVDAINRQPAADVVPVEHIEERIEEYRKHGALRAEAIALAFMLREFRENT